MIRNKMGMLLLVCFASAMLVSCQKDKQNQKVDSDDNVDPLAMESELAILALDGRIESGKGSAAFDWVTPFETATGCKVKAVQLNGNDLFASTLAGKQFDLVIVADSFLSSDVFQKSISLVFARSKILMHVFPTSLPCKISSVCHCTGNSLSPFLLQQSLLLS